MKRTILLVLTLGLQLQAQSPQLLLSRFPYQAETPRPRPLDWQAMMAEIPTLELESTPLNLPDELQFTAGELTWVR